MSEEKETTSTEAPVGTSAPAGGKDPHRDAERAKESSEGDQGQPIKQPEDQGAGDQNEQTPTPEEQASADDADATKAEADAATAPTPEEQAELDSMVDYVVKEGDNFPNLPDGTPVNVGDTVKLAKDHPLVTGQQEG